MYLRYDHEGILLGIDFDYTPENKGSFNPLTGDCDPPYGAMVEINTVELIVPDHPAGTPMGHADKLEIDTRFFTPYMWALLEDACMEHAVNGG